MAAPQDGICFDDIAVVFSEEEWRCLGDAHRALYKQVMLDNYQMLVSVCEPTVISRIQGGHDPWVTAAFPDTAQKTAGQQLPLESDESNVPGSSARAALARTHLQRSPRAGGDPPQRPGCLGSAVTDDKPLSRHHGKSKLRLKVIKWIIPPENASDPRDLAARYGRPLDSCAEKETKLSENRSPPKTSDCAPVIKHVEPPNPSKRSSVRPGPAGADHETIAPPGYLSMSSSDTRYRERPQTEGIGKKLLHQPRKKDPAGLVPSTHRNRRNKILPTDGRPGRSDSQTKPPSASDRKKPMVTYTVKRSPSALPKADPYPTSLSTSSFPKREGDEARYSDSVGRMSVTGAKCPRLSPESFHVLGKKSKSNTLTEIRADPSLPKARYSTHPPHRLRKVTRVPEECRKCGKRFSVLVKQTRKTQLPSSAGPRRPRKTCAECRLVSSQRRGGAHSCRDCGKRFLQKSVLDLHQRSHAEEKLFVCPTCGKRFVQQSLLIIHQGTHKNNKPFQCMECGNLFYSKKIFLDHQRSHKEQKPHCCSDCGKCFADNTTLLIHRRIHTGEKPFSCGDCGKSFSQHSTLVSHQRIHTGEKPYECVQCGKRFGDRSALASHHRTHTGDRPFRCQACGKHFAQSSNLRRHERLHTGQKPHVCPKCGKTFNEFTQLKYHENVHLKRDSKAPRK